MSRQALSVATAVAVAILVGQPAFAATLAHDRQALITAVEQAASRIGAAAFLDVAGCAIDVSAVAGVADRRTRAAAPINAPLRIGSVGKLYTAAVLHRLAARGIIDLDQPVGAMLRPDDAPGVANRTASLRQLLNHSSGVPDYYALPDIRRWDRRQPLTPGRILAAIAGRRATSPPGGRYAYSNSGYHLAALATERATGQGIAELINAEVIAPLGLSATRYHEEGPGGVLHGYVGRVDQWESAENSGPDGGITAPLADLRRFMRALFIDEGPLRPAGDAMIANPVETGRPRQRAGAGAEVRESRNGLALVGHLGDVEGYLTFAYAAPAHGLTMIGHITASDPAVLTELLRATDMVVARACGRATLR